jgi:hypothetical protein
MGQLPPRMFKKTRAGYRAETRQLLAEASYVPGSGSQLS